MFVFSHKALVEVIISSDEELFVRAVILLGEILHLVSSPYALEIFSSLLNTVIILIINFFSKIGFLETF